MKMLKIALARTRKKIRTKFAYVLGRELHCFRRYRPIRLVLHPLVGLRKRQRDAGYAVSELSTLARVSGGRTKHNAIHNSRARLRSCAPTVKEFLKELRRARKYYRSRTGRRNFACA